MPKKDSTIDDLQNQIASHIQTIKKELDRLNIRQAAILRCKANLLNQRQPDFSEDEGEDNVDIVENIDAIEYDLTTFRGQLQERLEHLKRSLRLLSIYKDNELAHAFNELILEQANLVVRDARVAREGYDELISSINEMTHMRDQ